MPEFAFPPEQPWLLTPQVALLINLALSAILVGALVYVLRRPRRPASRAELVWGVIGIVSTTLLARIVWGCTLTTELGKHRETQSSDFGFFLFSLLAILLLIVSCPARVRTATGAGTYSAVGFSLLCVMGFVMGWLWPAVRGAQESARRSVCHGHLKQNIIALHNDMETRGRFLTSVIDDGQQPARSWRVELLPYLDGIRLRKLYHDDEPWNGPSNSQLLDLMPSTYSCPSAPDDGTRHQKFTAYAMVTGETVFGTSAGRTWDELRDERQSNLHVEPRSTIAIVEACGRQIPWLEPRDVQLVDEAISINRPGAKPGTSRSILSSHHPYHANVALVDGRIKTLSEKIDPAVLKALLTVPCREPVAIPDK